MTGSPLYLALTFDAEADAFDRSIASDRATGSRWLGIEEGIPAILDVLRDKRDSDGRKLHATWFVRTDTEIGQQCGDPAFLLKCYQSLWQDRASAGDEIGFHAHFSASAKSDPTGETACAEVRDALTAVRECGIAPQCSRMGEGFFSNAIAGTLCSTGFACDSTAMPGRRRHDGERILDWTGTPDDPYWPSKFDYRIPGDLHRGILEIPMSMAEVKAAYDVAPIRRYIDLSFHHEMLRPGLMNVASTAPLLVAVTHPSTVLSALGSSGHGLLSFSLSDFRRNLECIFETCDGIGREVRATTLSEYARHYADAKGVSLS